MLPHDKQPGSPEDWLLHAESDLAYALAPVPEGGLLTVSCFHAQQAVEKGLKALLLKHGVEQFPRTHNIGTLLDLLPETVGTSESIQQSRILSPYAVSTRYPSDPEEITGEERNEAVRLAQLVVDWVREQLK